jgi:benzoyl-CoA reductase subunit D
MAGRLAKLLRVIKVKEGITLATGGLALDDGLMAALNESMVKQKIKVEARSHPDSIFAGAIGAALWGAFRYEKLQRLEALAKAS